MMWWGCYWSLVCRDQGWGKHPTMYRVALIMAAHIKPRVSMMLRLRNPNLGILIFWSIFLFDDLLMELSDL